MENYKNSKIGQETAQKYGDIIEMERPQTEESLRKHPRMTLQNRAKIFSPFAALRGYDEQLAAEKQRTEVGDSAEEDAADQDPQQDRQPAERGSLDGTGDRACTCDGGELVGEHRPAVGGNVVFAILQPHSRSFGVGVDTPGLGEPTAISGVRTYQDNRGNQNDYKRIHFT